jgi:GNAT superfamily N-acetyltransferase
MEHAARLTGVGLVCSKSLTQLPLLGAHIHNLAEERVREVSLTHIEVRLGNLDDMDDAVSVYERSNLARLDSDWPERPAHVAQVTASLHDTALHDATSWFLIGRDGGEAVAMALIQPFRASGGSGQVVPDTWSLSLLYVLPNRWGKGIGGTMLNAVIKEANRRGCHRISLWTHERQNERAH